MERHQDYAMYLRKSRADLEAEQRGEKETLARHRATLREVAARRGLKLVRVYEEIASAEGIASRPVMQELLRDVESGRWAGVLVMELERLARGDTLDQGLVAQAFKYTGTLIVTPQKTYDPNDEFDEEYVEFGLFMSRREYKTINRRMNAGRVASANAGKWVAGPAPYGYAKRKLEREQGFELVVVPDEAEVVRQMFQWHVWGEVQDDGSVVRIGYHKIAAKLDALGVPTPSGATAWSRQSVRKILSNPVYAGLIRWKHRAAVKQMKEGGLVVSHPINDAPILAQGRHEAILDQETWRLAQQRLAEGCRPTANPAGTTVANALAGLVYCGRCGHKMQRNRRPDGAGSVILCPNRGCDNKAVSQRLLEEAVFEQLRQLSATVQWGEEGAPLGLPGAAQQQKQIDCLIRSQDQLEQQLLAAHNLLERGVYDAETFGQRVRHLGALRQGLAGQLNDAKRQYDTLLRQEYTAADRPIIVEAVLAQHQDIATAGEKNKLLREMVDRIVVVKERVGKGHLDDFVAYLQAKAF